MKPENITKDVNSDSEEFDDQLRMSYSISIKGKVIMFPDIDVAAVIRHFEPEWYKEEFEKWAELQPPTWGCPNCGNEYDDEDEAAECCTECPDCGCAFPQEDMRQADDGERYCIDCLKPGRLGKSKTRGREMSKLTICHECHSEPTAWDECAGFKDDFPVCDICLDAHCEDNEDCDKETCPSCDGWKRQDI